MPPQFALLIFILLIIYLFWVDRKKNEGVSNAIWIPLIWMLIAGSRSLSQWFKLGPPVMTADAYLKGSPANSAIFLILIIAGVVILRRRRLNWGKIFKNNQFIWLFFLFGLISILWSEYPFVSFKRWIKALGTMSMVLIILTEQRPYEAIGVILRRFSFLLLPLSVLLIKYYPSLGRTYHMGELMFMGIASQKNGLGQICLISGIYFCWNLLFSHHEGIKLKRKRQYSVYVIIIPMIVWLLYMANSATSQVCLVVALCLLLVGRIPAVVRKPRRFVTLMISFLAVFGILELFFDITNAVTVMVGRDSNLTCRVPIWKDLLAMVKNPLVGVGYEAFWAGERMTQIWEKVGANIINSHNGYIDIYLSIGIVGLLLLLISIIAGVTKAIKHLNHEYAYTILRISLIITVVFYNWTEASFKQTSNMFFLLLVGILYVPSVKVNQKQQQIQIKKVPMVNK